MPTSINPAQPPINMETIRRFAANAQASPELMQYIEKSVFPCYTKNDKGHQLEHVFYVIWRSLPMTNMPAFSKRFRACLPTKRLFMEKYRTIISGQ